MQLSRRTWVKVLSAGMGRVGISREAMKRPRRMLYSAFVLAVIAASGASASANSADKSRNVELIESFRYKKTPNAFYNGTDIDFHGKYAYGAQLGPFGGIHVFDVSGDTLREVSFIPCPGTQNDVAVVRAGIVALGYHESQCGRERRGIQLLDLSDPREPRLLGSVAVPGDGTHTLTLYPGKPIIYSSPGGPGGEDSETIIDVSDPQKPKIAATFDPGSNIGCHDVSFHFRGKQKLGFCAGGNATQIWDVSNPLKPRIIGQVVNPSIFFHHSVAATPDGRYLVIGDEGIGACTGTSTPTGAIFIYDITQPELPVPVSYFGLHREEPLICTAHNFNFIPGSRILVSSWYRGGMNMIDLTDPARPTEIAHYRAEETDYWSAYWYRNRVYASGLEGLDVFEVQGLNLPR